MIDYKVMRTIHTYYVLVDTDCVGSYLGMHVVILSSLASSESDDRVTHWLDVKRRL